MFLRDFKIIDEPYSILKNGIMTSHLKPGPPSPLETAAEQAGTDRGAIADSMIEHAVRNEPEGAQAFAKYLDELLPRETCIKL